LTSRELRVAAAACYFSGAAPPRRNLVGVAVPARHRPHLRALEGVRHLHFPPYDTQTHWLGCLDGAAHNRPGPHEVHVLPANVGDTHHAKEPIGVFPRPAPLPSPNTCFRAPVRTVRAIAEKAGCAGHVGPRRLGVPPAPRRWSPAAPPRATSRTRDACPAPDGGAASSTAATAVAAAAAAGSADARPLT